MKRYNEEGTRFTTHGVYIISNCYSVEVEISDCGDMGRYKSYNDTLEDYDVSEWKPIELLQEEGTDLSEDSIPVLDPEGLYIPLNQVMRVTK